MAGADQDDESWQEAYDDLFPRIEEQVRDEREKVRELGGLFILGEERWEDRTRCAWWIPES